MSLAQENGIASNYAKSKGWFLPLDPKFWEQEMSPDDVEFLCSALDSDEKAVRKKVDDIQRE